MRKAIILFIVLFSTSVNAQQTGVTNTDTLRVGADTVRAITLIPTKSLYTIVVAMNDTTILDTVDVFNITEKFDTVRVAVRSLRTYQDSEFIVLSANRKTEFLILSPSMNRVYIKARNTVVGLLQRYYLRTARVQ